MGERRDASESLLTSAASHASCCIIRLKSNTTLGRRCRLQSFCVARKPPQQRSGSSVAQAAAHQLAR
eukprot:3637875-Pleurochrysis_carterae.AAC.1